MTNASLNRQTAIGMLTELYFSEGHDSPYLWEQCEGRLATGHEVAENIAKLATLGRTARWQGAIDSWARSVRENSGNPKSLRWAYMQGLVYASHASQ